MSTPRPPNAGGPDDPAGRRRLIRAITATSISLLIFVSIGYGGWRLLRSTPGPKPVACPSAPPSAATAPTLGVRVLNGTSRSGLAGRTADLLRQRGFRIAGVGNAPRLPGRSQIRYAPREAPSARVTALQLNGALLVADKTVSKRVDIVLGDAFRRLRTPAEVTAASRKAKLPTPRPTAPCR